MASTVLLRPQDGDDIYLRGTNRVAWDGTGTPWSASNTTPFTIGMNDVTGAPFVIPSPTPEPISSGMPPFAWLPRDLMFGYTPRTLDIPIQAYAASTNDLPELASLLRRTISRAFTEHASRLEITYDSATGSGSRTVYLLIIRGTFQETPSFWNQEDGTGAMRGVLTLTCAPFGTLNADLGNNSVSDAAFNNPDTLDWSSLKLGDSAFSVGSPMLVGVTQGDIATAAAKRVYVASIDGTPGSTTGLSSAINTTSTTGVAVTGNATEVYVFSPTRRARALCAITSPNTHLQVRAIWRYTNASGAIIKTGEWVTAGTTTTYLDLGFVQIPPINISGSSISYYVSLEARSSSGSAATGTLTRIDILSYYQFAVIDIATTGSNTGLVFGNEYDPLLDGVGFAADDYAYVRNGSNAIEQIIPIRGQLPRAYGGSRLWMAWTAGGVYDSTDTVNAFALVYPMYAALNGDL